MNNNKEFCGRINFHGIDYYVYWDSLDLTIWVNKTNEPHTATNYNKCRTKNKVKVLDAAIRMLKSAGY